ncbi:MAG: oligosaccharide flippase family protein [Glaciecola sp.]
MSGLKKLIISSSLLIADAIGQKLVGLISTVILARILLPEDFGIIAIALIFLGLTQVLSNTGSLQYLLRVDKINKDIVNTAWTISFYTKVAIAILFVALSYPIAYFYDDTRLILLIVALMGIFVIQALRNPAEVYLKRNQNYNRIVALNIVSKILAVILSVLVAVIYKSYWALVAGQFVNAFIGTIGSYIIQPHTLRLTLTDSKAQWLFSKWMIPQSLFGYLRTQLDTIIVSAFFGRAELGSFHTMKYLAYLPSANFLIPAMQPLLVELSHFKNNKIEFSKRFNTSFLIPFIISIPITSILVIYHDLITFLILGPQWVEFSPILGYFALLIPANVIFQTCSRTLIIYAHSRFLFIAEIVMFTLIYGGLLLINLQAIEDFTLLRALLENLFCLTLIIVVSLALNTRESTLSLIVILLVTLCATLPAYQVTLYINFSYESKFILLLLNSTLFVMVYFATIFICYYLLKEKLSDLKYTSELIKKIIRRGK